jgi:hypothetical protein
VFRAQSLCRQFRNSIKSLLLATLLLCPCLAPSLLHAEPVFTCDAPPAARELFASRGGSIIFNNMSSVPLNIYTMGVDLNPHFFGTLAARSQYSQRSVGLTAWLVKDTNGNCMAYALPSTEGTDVPIADIEAQPPSNLPDSPGDDPLQAALDCQSAGYTGDQNVERFAGCWVMQMATPSQKFVADCVIRSGDWQSTTFCLANHQLSPEGQNIVSCAQAASSGQGAPLEFCASALGGATAETTRLVGCVASNSGNYYGMALCAGGNKLTPEQQVFAECAYQTGLDPLAFTGCAGGTLTANELQKCLTTGIGGEGCFGDNNTLVKLIRSTWKGVAGGPNSVLNRPGQIFGGPNSFFRQPAQIFGGRNSVFNNPNQLLGGSNSFVRNPGQIWGGPNSVVRNPDQLLGGRSSFFHKNLGIHL